MTTLIKTIFSFRFHRKCHLLSAIYLVLLTAVILPVEARGEPASQADEIKAYCIDFNWAPSNRRGKPFAAPGRWANSDPAEHVAWYKSIGANVIQTFCVSTNGYAWYKNGFVPEQPGLKHDFLPEVVKLGHKEGMKVMGYFCIASNPRWAEMHPELSYGSPTTYHIPYTDEYLDFLSKSIHDAVSRTGIDGFMIDWLWMPNRKSTEGKWLECEKKLYKQLMGKDFPGEDKLSRKDDTAYSRKSIDRCWKAIRKAAKSANPKCIVWLTVNKMHHPHAVNSEMYKEVDWLMNEAGSVEEIHKVKGMVGKHTQLITCLAVWNGQDASKTVPAAIKAGVGLYGFTTPRDGKGLVPLKDIFNRQMTELSGDSKNIAMLARAYSGKSAYSKWKDDRFVEPVNPPPFRLTFQRRGRGLQDTASIESDTKQATIVIRTPYGKGNGQLVRIGKSWGSSIIIQLEKKPGSHSGSKVFRITNGEIAVDIPLDGSAIPKAGKVAPKKNRSGRLQVSYEIDPKKTIKDLNVSVKDDGKSTRIVLPDALLKDNPQTLDFEWVVK